MQITRKSDYAIRCILHLVLNQGRICTVGEISEAQDVPKTFTAKILQQLVKMGIASSTKGVKGGFTLAKAPEEVTLLDAIEAVEGPLAMNRCVVDTKSCSRSASCSVHPVWVDLKADMEKTLRSYNFKQLAGRSL